MVHICDEWGTVGNEVQNSWIQVSYPCLCALIYAKTDQPGLELELEGEGNTSCYVIVKGASISVFQFLGA